MNKEIISNPFEIFDKQWALVTAGSFSHHNSMTISWGAMGTIWNKRVVTIYIKPARYTHKFIEENEYFVLSFFKEEYRNALSIMGSISGRNADKDKEAKLTPMEHNGVTIYKEADMTLICKKIYQNDLDKNAIPKEQVDRYYKVEEVHTMYIGEVVEIIK